ncbi:MAG: hypothetical protein JWM33_3603 [Caulobacteraceae bacterium]|nr:hypothetical protein [Caulobacteraceae bacterium]
MRVLLILAGASWVLAGAGFAAPAPDDPVAQAAHFLHQAQDTRCSLESPLCVYGKMTMINTVGGLLFALPDCTLEACSGQAGEVAAAAKLELAKLDQAETNVIPRVRDPSFQAKADAALKELSTPCTLGQVFCTQGRLGVLARIDQAVRAAPCPAIIIDPPCDRAKNAQMVWIDTISSDWLIYMFDHQGWPSARIYGENAEELAWLLAQHADLRPALQRRALSLVRAAAQREGGQSEKRHVAYLEDRLAVHDERPQTYGTQTKCVANKGLISFTAIADPAHVNERRAEMGMGPLAEYLNEVATENNCPIAAVQGEDR